MTDVVLDGPADSAWTIVLAHGAGAPMDAPFMEYIVGRLAESGLRVARFEFPYMAARRRDGRRRGPDRGPIMIQTWQAVIGALGPRRLIIGGKSMGGRIASMIADQAAVAGLVCLGYPFHPPGKPEQTRIDHLAELRTPTILCQGERDPFGTPDEVAAYRLSPSIRLHWLGDGDHSFKPRKSSGRTETQNWDEASAVIAAFAAGLPSPSA